MLTHVSAVYGIPLQKHALELPAGMARSCGIAFVLDYHDREVIAWLAITSGISGEMIRDMMVHCVERRFGGSRAPHKVQWLTDNGSIFAAYKTIDIALALNLEPCFTPVESPESNGMAEAFVKTLKRDYVPHSLSAKAGWRTTTLFTRTCGWATAHPENTSMPNPNPPRVRSNRVNSTN